MVYIVDAMTFLHFRYTSLSSCTLCSLPVCDGLLYVRMWTVQFVIFVMRRGSMIVHMIEFSGIHWLQTFSHQLRSPSALTSFWPSLPSPLTFNPYLISSPHHFLSSTSQMVVAGFSAHTDLSKAQEIRNEVHRVMRNLKECQALSQTYNQRERLFGMDQVGGVDGRGRGGLGRQK